MRTFRIGIDCRLAGQRHAGIGRYTVELVKHVTAHDTIDWVLFYSDQDQIKQIFANSIPKNCILIHAPVRHYTLKEQVAMNKIFIQANLDLLHVPHFNIPILYTKPLVITIHDLLWHEYRGAEVTTLPAWKYWIKYGFYRYVTAVAIRKALRIFVPTKVVQHTLEKYFPHAIGKITVTPEGVGERLHSTTKKDVKRNSTQLLYVGSLYPHKNVELLLRALQKLPQYSLTIVSARNVFKEKLEKVVAQLNLQKQVTFASNIGDEELATLYQTCAALIQPSFSEGFGLTGLEALSFNTPVLASDIPVFREVYQNAAIYFDPNSVDSFANAINTLESAEKTKKLITAAPTVVAQYKWEDLAQTTFDQYMEALHANE